MSPQLGRVYRLTSEKLREILRTRKCPNCGRQFRELTIRRKGNSKIILATHYDEDKRKVYQHYIGAITNSELERLISDGDPVVRLSKIIREKGTTLDGWLEILNELERDVEFLIASEEDKERLTKKLKEINERLQVR